MNIYIVTLYAGNYGSCLQAYALQTRLNEFGGNSFVLARKEPKKRFSKIHSIWKILKPEKHYSLYQRIQRKIQSREFVEKKEKLARFVSQNISIQTIKDRSSFVRGLPAEDIFLAGSDQVWNILNSSLSSWYSLQWVNDGHKKYSYSASIGLSTLTENQKQEYVKGLATFQIISLRESQAVEALSSSFHGKIRQDIDPTLLFDATFWRKHESPQLLKEPYIFVYMLRPNIDVIRIARKIAKEKGCQIIFTGQFADKFKGVKTICNAGIEEFLSYIDHAEVVVTNSFHGTVFSILFGKPFLSVKLASTGSRAESLLNLLGLESQLVEDAENGYSLNINYSNVYTILDKEREKSLNYLKSICNTI